MECKGEAEGDNNQETEHPNQQRHSSGRFQRKAKQFRKNNDCRDLYSTPDSGDLHDTAEGNKANENKDIDHGESCGCRESSKEEIVAGHDHNPFQNGIEEE